MSEQVKRYDAVHIRYEDNNIHYGEGCEVEVVTAADYEREVRIAIAAGQRMQDKCDALQAEADALRKRARTAEREASQALRTLKGLEKVAKVVDVNSDQVCGENNLLRQEVEALRKRARPAQAAPQELRIVLDGPPGPEAGRFVEVENAAGRSVNAGEWRERADGLWELVLHATQGGE